MLAQLIIPESFSGGAVLFFHDRVMAILVLIISVVGYALLWCIKNQFSFRHFENQVIELWWTVIPAVILFVLGFFSLRLLYFLDDTSNRTISIKAIGHQWYWSYEYGEIGDLIYDSYIVPTKDLRVGDFRLLEVDNRVVLPTNTDVRVLVTSGDVIHSWALPALSIKVDAVPGRINQVNLFGSMPGVVYGQCSEICGANHSFMPIVVELVPVKSFLSWVEAIKKEL